MVADESAAQYIVLTPETDFAHTLYVFKKLDVVRFVLSPEVRRSNVRFSTNYPDEGVDFNRRPLARKTIVSQNGEKYVDIILKQAGTYEFELSRVEDGDASVLLAGFFQVDPTLRVGVQDVPLDGLMVQTVIPRALGVIGEWLPRLEVSAHSGFNMVHFTPVNEIGESRSAYSLADHQVVDSELVGEVNSEDGWTSLDKVLEIVRRPKSEGGLGMLCAGDVVWNHTASNSKWIEQHPEAGYNLEVCPYLIPAFLLDEALQLYSRSLKDRKPIQSVDEIYDILSEFEHQWLPKLRLWEFLVVNIEDTLKAFRVEVTNQVTRMNGSLDGVDNAEATVTMEELVRVQSYSRKGLRIDIKDAASRFLAVYPYHQGEHISLFVNQVSNHFKVLMDQLNLPIYNKLNEDIQTAISNVKHAMVWERLDPNGPKKQSFTDKDPITSINFVRCPGWNPSGKQLEIDSLDVTCFEPRYILACNGWIWGGNPLENFAGPDSSAYLRRDIQAWGDSIKLRYGTGPEDNPWLWSYMDRYTARTAKSFDALRIDNCHSTPVHVAQHLLDTARKVKPDLFVFAELFTDDKQLDMAMTATLGLNALIREAMSASSVRDLSRLVHEYGGPAIGSFGSYQNPYRPKLPLRNPRALFMDCSHDNELICDKFTNFCAIPLVAFVSMSSSSTGSNRGVDEMIQSKVKVVGESRKYRNWNGSSSTGVCIKDGIIKVRQVLNKLHNELATDFTEIYIDMITDSVFTVTRHCPKTHRSVTAIAAPVMHSRHQGEIQLPPIKTMGKVVNIRVHIIQDFQQTIQSQTKDEDLISGIEWKHTLATDIEPASARFCSVDRDSDGLDTINFSDFAHGSVVIFEVAPTGAAVKAASNLNELQSSATDSALRKCIVEAVEKLDLKLINKVLFRSQPEEEEVEHQGGGDYNIPGYGSLPYSGIQGPMTVLEKVYDNNDLAHPICDNIRAGDWLMDFSVHRLDCESGFPVEFCEALRRVFSYVKVLPRGVIPARLLYVLSWIHGEVLNRALSLMNNFVLRSPLSSALAVASLQFYGRYARSTLPYVSDPTSCSVSAGLPHFAAGWMRTWGRDTFIAVRGLFLVLGRAVDAKHVILDFARTVRHGLLPNLFDHGNNPRYNCRDAVWWFLQAVQDYTLMVPGGMDILNTKVDRCFTKDDKRAPSGTIETLGNLVQEIMQRHCNGINYREWNAGSAIDDKMSNEGFNVSIRLDPLTGFVHGGSEYNCGTWMDKMGESSIAGNIGHPATPRDGADVEIIGLLKSTVRWLAQINKAGLFKYSGVDIGDETLTYEDWSNRILQSFEKHFWVPDTGDDDNKYAIDSKWVHRRGIYKDVTGSTHGFTDYQLRPNFCVAMVVAPELFTKEHAQRALEKAEELLLGGLGMRTLDPADMNYRPNYHNGVDNSDFKTSRGFNYHQGPEWVWPVGYFLRAKLAFASNKSTAADEIHDYLLRYEKTISDSSWKGIPEICNENGVINTDGCPTQAWSVSCLLDILYDLNLEEIEAQVSM